MKDSSKYQLTIFHFFSLGLWSILTQSIVLWIAVEDILAGTLYSSSVVLLTFSIPDVITKAVSPSIITRISFRLSFALLTSFLVGAYVLLVLIDDFRIRIVGVGILGIALGFGEIICVRLLSFYENSDVLANAFQNGCNASLFMASLLYTGLTTWLCMAPRIVLAVCIPLCFMPLVFYFLLDKEPIKDYLRKTTDRQSVKYTIVSTNTGDQDNDTTSPNTKAVSKFWFFFKIFPLLGYTYVSNFITHFTMVVVLTTLTFPSSPFPPRDHFQYYRFINDIGCMLGGIVSLLFSCLDTKWIELFRIRKIWVLALLNVSHLIFFVVASWYRFLPNIIVVLVMCFTQGVVNGLTLVNCAANLTRYFSSASDRGTALGLLQVALSVGRIVAALLGISIEKLLKDHCAYELGLGRFCLARHTSSAEWSTNLSCKT